MLAFCVAAGIGGFSATVVSAAGAGFFGGFTATALSGASLGQALTSGLISGATAALTAGVIGPMLHGIDASTPLGFVQKTAGHGLTGGLLNAANSKLQNGSFRDGFLSGFVSSAAGPLINSVGRGLGDIGKAIRTVLAAAVGGTAAEIGGGKFTNGAVTAAFLRLYNDEQEIAAQMAEEYSAESRSREVNAWFNKDEGWLWIGNYRTGESVTLTGFSGGDFGSAPAPDGVYSIVRDPRNTLGERWFGLFRHDGVEINDATRVADGLRTGIRFHRGTRSIGCITITCAPEDWVRVQNIVTSGLDQRVLTWRWGVETRLYPSTSYGKMTVY